MNPEEFIAEWNNSEDFIEAMTSGSTGSPKKIRLSKKDLIISAQSTNNFFSLGKGSRFVCPMDFKYIGAKMMYVRSLVGDGSLVACKPSNNFEFEGYADLLAIVPSQVDCLLSDESMQKRTRNIIIGGAPLDEMREKRLIESGLKAYKTYGMTETGSHVALSPVGNDVYEALPGITFELDRRGCLVVHMEGRDNDVCVTNDIAELISSRKFRWRGRYDNVINSGGIKIFPEELETVIIRCLRMRNLRFEHVVVFGENSEKWGSTPVAIIVSRDGIDTTTLEDIKRLAGQEIDDTRKLPKRYVVTAEIPYAGNNKPDRAEIQRLFSK